MKSFSSGLITLFLLTNLASANVSLKNGNFFVGYYDLVYSGGFNPSIERVYNSKSTYNGIFGFGWGTGYEVYLQVAADGSVVVYEFGGGAENRFVPPNPKDLELDRAIKDIVAVAKKIGAFATQEKEKEYSERLKRDLSFRNDEWEKFIAQGKLKPRQLKDGTQLVSNKFSFQYITKTKNGYVRSYDTGKTESFNDDGKLVKLTDKNKNFVEFSYTKDGKLSKLVDNFSRKMFFTFNSQGKVTKVSDDQGKKESNYRYNDKGELVWVKDAGGNVYEYKYGDGHNLTGIHYADGKKMEVAYYGPDKFGSVKSVKDKDGSVTDYDYAYDKNDKGYRKVAVNLKAKDGSSISKSSYEYFLKYKADGQEWTHKLAQMVDNEKTETTYNECCGLPVSIKRGKEETTFDYDGKGRVLKKVTPTEVTQLQYHNKFGKVVKVQRSSRLVRQPASWAAFDYDDRGNLVQGKNSENKTVRLVYDNNGRIKNLADQNKRQISFKYNENSKPVEILDSKYGAITVNYTNSGDIKSLESPKGEQIAAEVTRALQNLLDIIRPAGVSLTF